MSKSLVEVERQVRLAQIEPTLWSMGISGLQVVIPAHIALDIAILIKEHRQLRIDVLKMSINKQLNKKWEHQQPELDHLKDLATQLGKLLTPDPSSDSETK
jgi:hypothetical protein